MKIPNVFVPDEDLEEKIKEYTNKCETPDYMSKEKNKELYNKITDIIVRKLGYPRSYAGDIVKNFISTKGILYRKEKNKS